jgi:hypothetical protein
MATRLKLRLPRNPEGSPPEPVRIRIGSQGPDLWVDVVSTSSKWVELHFVDVADAYCIDRNSLLKEDEKATFERKKWTPQRSKV